MAYLITKAGVPYTYWPNQNGRDEHIGNAGPVMIVFRDLQDAGKWIDMANQGDWGIMEIAVPEAARNMSLLVAHHPNHKSTRHFFASDKEATEWFETTKVEHRAEWVLSAYSLLVER